MIQKEIRKKVQSLNVVRAVLKVTPAWFGNDQDREIGSQKRMISC